MTRPPASVIVIFLAIAVIAVAVAGQVQRCHEARAPAWCAAGHQVPVRGGHDGTGGYGTDDGGLGGGGESGGGESGGGG